MNTTPSPSFLKSIWNLFIIVFFPAICIIWGVRCLKDGRSEAIYFFIFALVGIAEVTGLGPARMLDAPLDAKVFLYSAYSGTLFFILMFLRVFEDEREK